MTIAIITAAVVLAALLLVFLLHKGHTQKFSRAEVEEWNAAEREAQRLLDEAEREATQEVATIQRETGRAIQVVQNTTTKQVERDLSSRDPEKTLQDALDEYDVRHGIKSLLPLALPWLPLLWGCWVLAGCSTVHGAGSGVEAPTVTVKRATWERAVRTLRTCTAEVSKQKLLVKQAEDVARVQCDRRVKQCRAVTEACRKQRGVLMSKGCPGCTRWIVATTVATIAALAAGGAALYFAFRPTVTLNTSGGTP